MTTANQPMPDDELDSLAYSRRDALADDAARAEDFDPFAGLPATGWRAAPDCARCGNTGRATTGGCCGLAPPVGRHPATNAPGRTRRRVHETAAWIARYAYRARSDGALHVHGIARTIQHYPPPLRPAHLTPWQRAVLARALGLTGHVMCRDGRIVHRSTVRPPSLAVGGHAYRNRTRRRTRSRR